MNLPQQVDLTPEGLIVEKAELGTQGYVENYECNLTITFNGGYAQIYYVSENDDWIEVEEVIKALGL